MHEGNGYCSCCSMILSLSMNKFSSSTNYFKNESKKKNMFVLRAVGVASGLASSIGLYYTFVVMPFEEAHASQMVKASALEEQLLSSVTFSGAPAASL